MINTLDKHLKKKWMLSLSNQVWSEKINYSDGLANTDYLSKVFNVNSTVKAIKEFEKSAILQVILGNENAYYSSDAIVTGANWNRLRLATTFTKTYKKLAVTAHQQLLTNTDKVYLTGGLKARYFQSRYQNASLSLDRVIKLPTLNELYWYQPSYAIGNVNLKPEEGYKADLTGSIERKGFRVELNPFAGYYQNWISWVGVPQIQAQNFEAVFVRGTLLELSYQKRVKQRTVVVLSHVNWTKATFVAESNTDSRDGKQMIYTPELTGNLVVSFIGRKMGLHISEQFVGTNYFTSDNSASLDPYFLTEIGGYYQIKRWRLGLNAGNVLNAAYYTQPRTPLPGRTLKININYNIPIRPWKEKSLH
jgi:outer membrane receptor protein involved in Fe transport